LQLFFFEKYQLRSESKNIESEKYLKREILNNIHTNSYTTATFILYLSAVLDL
jgi:hypothetical protein